MLEKDNIEWEEFDLKGLKQKIFNLEGLNFK